MVAAEKADIEKYMHPANALPEAAATRWGVFTEMTAFWHKRGPLLLKMLICAALILVAEVMTFGDVGVDNDNKTAEPLETRCRDSSGDRPLESLV